MSLLFRYSLGKRYVALVAFYGLERREEGYGVG